MLCPICAVTSRASDTRVVDTRRNSTGNVMTRKRVCTAEAEHRFATTERWPVPELDQIYVRRSSDRRVSGQFSRDLLRSDVSAGVLRRLSTDALASVVEDVCSGLADQIETLGEPMSAEEAASLEAVYPTTVNDYDIMLAVERRLRRESDRVAHIFYSLSFRGGVDPSTSGSFKTAADFLEWFYSDTAYPDLREPIPSATLRPETAWWPPRTPKLPELVIKRDGARKRFGFEQFKNSLNVALLGRPQAEQTAHQVALFALFHLEGQPIVRSSQLADQALSTLRMVDDIAYLRFAGIAKDFVSVRDFGSEARELIATPSPKLRFALDNLTAAVPVGNFGIKEPRERGPR